MTNDRNQWFDRRLSIGNLITIGVVLAGAMAGWFRFENRLTLVETHRSSDKAAFEELRTRVGRIEEQRNDLTFRVIRIEERLTGQTELLQRILKTVEHDARR